MKRKILALGVFALCALALITGDVQAFGGGLFNPYNPYSLWNRNNRFTTQITVRPYNAFTPICWGNLVCDGVCPAPCGAAAGCLPMQFGVPPFASIGGCGVPPLMGMGMNPSMYGYYGPTMGLASDMPPMPIQTGPGVPNPFYHPGPGVNMQLPDIRNQPPGFLPPMPHPIGPGTTMYQQSPSPISQATYQQGGYPMVNPGYYHPAYAPQMSWPQQYQQVPSYWYGSGR